MKIKTAFFSGSSPIYTQGPQTPGPELALLGRSNVGKSSLINMLLGHKQLAKTSGKPGKTRLINHFLVNNAWYLVDLPGYGWAQVSKAQRQQWTKMIRAYLLHSKQLLCVMVVVDARHQPQESDIALLDWLEIHHIPFLILLTKADKVAKHRVQRNLAVLQDTLSSYWDVLPQILVTSSRDRTGRAELLCSIQRILDKKNATGMLT